MQDICCEIPRVSGNENNLRILVEGSLEKIPKTFNLWSGPVDIRSVSQPIGRKGYERNAARVVGINKLLTNLEGR
jgi:hypothetical protein